MSRAATYKSSQESHFSDSEDIFDCTKPDNTLIEIKLKTIIKMTGKTRAYDISSDKRGRCLIINNFMFNSLKTRHGSEIDLINLTTAFRDLEFHVIVKGNIPSQGFSEVIEQELLHTDHQKLGMFVLVIMSHRGEGGKIFGTDDVGIDLHTLLKRIYDSKRLKGKPKFIAIHACPGSDVVKRDDKETRKLIQSPENCAPSASNKSESALPDDVLILRSDFDAFASDRDAEFGSPFVRALVEALLKHANHCDLEAICKQVKNKMRIYNIIAERNGIHNLSITSCTSTLNKKVFLLPGLSWEYQAKMRKQQNERKSALFTPVVTNSSEYNAPVPVHIASKSSAAKMRKQQNERKSAWFTTVVTNSSEYNAPVPVHITSKSSAGKITKYWNDYHSVRWISENLYIATCADGIQIFQKDRQLIAYLALKDCDDIAVHGENLLILYQSLQGTKKIALYTQQLREINNCVCSASNWMNVGFSQVATRHGVIVATDGPNKCAYVWSTDGALLNQIKLSDMAQPLGVCITADKELIVSNFTGFGYVTKYQIEGNTYIRWNSSRLHFPWGIAEDSGFIYVSGGETSNKCVYQLNQYGILLKKLPFDLMKNMGTAYGISVIGNKLAVACGTDGVVLLSL